MTENVFPVHLNSLVWKWADTDSDLDKIQKAAMRAYPGTLEKGDQLEAREAFIEGAFAGQEMILDTLQELGLMDDLEEIEESLELIDMDDVVGIEHLNEARKRLGTISDRLSDLLD